ncbi:hypothetical protein COY07_03505 [Candidatus Peregrinibacteria bacterium CG_4_10_14_0_2_um_filter_43_11]|nr:MAG: hypothetical protein COY07_03505 [Candidatus Peregrinibacteria bacterium CG_4_10_14_0_2_um_filter_43_11]
MTWYRVFFIIPFIRHFDPPEAGGGEIPLPTISFKIGSDDIVSFYYGLAIFICSALAKGFLPTFEMTTLIISKIIQLLGLPSGRNW